MGEAWGGVGWGGVASSLNDVPQRVHPLHFVSSNALMSCLRMYVLKCLRKGRLLASHVSLFYSLLDPCNSVSVYHT